MYAALNGESRLLQTAFVKRYSNHRSYTEYTRCYPFLHNDFKRCHLLFEAERPFYFENKFSYPVEIRSAAHSYEKGGNLVLYVARPDGNHHFDLSFAYFSDSEKQPLRFAGENTLQFMKEQPIATVLELDQTSHSKGWAAIAVGNNVRMRDKPGLDGNIVDVLNMGDWLYIEDEVDQLWEYKNGEAKKGRGYNWLKVRKTEGGSAWVYGRYIAQLPTDEDNKETYLHLNPENNLFFPLRLYQL